MTGVGCTFLRAERPDCRFFSLRALPGSAAAKTAPNSLPDSWLTFWVKDGQRTDRAN
jgi:hypothetical protein